MKKTVLLLLFLSICLSSYSQFGGRRNNNSVVPQTNTEPSEREIEERKRQIEERKKEYVNNFLKTLEADEFQQEILKQTLSDFYSKFETFSKQNFDSSLAKKDAYEKFKDAHFKEVKTFISENDNKKLDEFLNGDFNEKEVVKKEKKKRKRKKKKKNKDKDADTSDD